MRSEIEKKGDSFFLMADVIIFLKRWLILQSWKHFRNVLHFAIKSRIVVIIIFSVSFLLCHSYFNISYLKMEFVLCKMKSGEGDSFFEEI